MNPKTAEKLDRSGQSHAAKISRPLDLSVFGDIHLTGSDRIIASAIRGFGRGENVAKFKYRELGARYNRYITPQNLRDRERKNKVRNGRKPTK